jgi:hypothetical protein
MPIEARRSWQKGMKMQLLSTGLVSASLVKLHGTFAASIFVKES